jgi:diguanylate cyclase (GGDEF)-like protein
MAESLIETPIKTSKNPEIQNQVDIHIRRLSKRRKRSGLTDINDEARDKVAAQLRIQRVKEALESTKEDAMKDKLTGLPNRRHMEDILQAKAAEATRKGKSFKVAIADVDHFKRVNDTFGHPVGDQMLQAFAEVDEEQAREEEKMGRWGGEEFLKIVDGDTDINGLSHMFTRLSQGMKKKSREILSQHNNIATDMDKVTFSMGVADYIPGVTSLADMIKKADEALYAAKHAGRDTLVYAMPVFDDTDSQPVYQLQPIPKMRISATEA